MQVQIAGNVKSNFFGRLFDSIGNIGNNRRLARFEENQALIKKIEAERISPEIIVLNPRNTREEAETYCKELFAKKGRAVTGEYIPADGVHEVPHPEAKSATWITEPKFWNTFIKRMDRSSIKMTMADFDTNESELARGYHPVKVDEFTGVLHVTKSSISAVLFHEGEFHAISSGPFRFGIKNRMTNITEERAKRFLAGH